MMAEAAKLYEMPGEIGDRKVYVVREGEEPHDHPGIDISISKQDSVHWISYGKKFRVTKLVPIDEKKDSAPEHPFYREFPGENPERSEEHTSELQSRQYLVCRLLLEKKKNVHSVLHQYNI